MIRKELVDVLTEKISDLTKHDAELAIRTILGSLIDSIASGQRVEIRGFGAFTLNERRARLGRNPKTGESVVVEKRFSVHFKPGLDLRDKVMLLKNQPTDNHL
jgi:integration host factor subunit beta